MQTHSHTRLSPTLKNTRNHFARTRTVGAYWMCAHVSPLPVCALTISEPMRYVFTRLMQVPPAFWGPENFGYSRHWSSLHAKSVNEETFSILIQRRAAGALASILDICKLHFIIGGNSEEAEICGTRVGRDQSGSHTVCRINPNISLQPSNKLTMFHPQPNVDTWV